MLRADTNVYQKTFSVLVDNEPGVLNRVVGLFSARGFNIESLSVGETQDPTLSRITVVVRGTATILEQVNKQLNKLIPVISVLPLENDEMIVEELILVKYKNQPKLESVVKGLKDHGNNVEVVNLTPKDVIVRIVANREQERVIFKALEAFEVVEMARTGEVAISKTRAFSLVEKLSR